MATQRIVKVKFSIEGMHRWPLAPEGYEYLANTHRHRFDFECTITEPESRFIEINEAADELKADLCIAHVRRAGWGRDFGGKSCEDLADETLQHIIGRWAPAHASIIVLEDGIQGGGVMYDADPST